MSQYNLSLDNQPAFLAEANGEYSLSGLASLEQIGEFLTEKLAEKVVGQRLSSPGAAREFLVPMLGAATVEKFVMVSLDSQHNVLKVETLSEGTIDSASVYPREVVKAAIRNNAAAVVLTHNHPSGEGTPSNADKRITKKLVDALGTIDVRVLDHLIVAGSDCVSMAERGLI